MRINEHICVSTQKIVLVPYAAHHVPKYHEWMKDPILTIVIGAQDIQQATASEPLTLEEEYAMQRTWRHDGDKLTFIVCRPYDLREPTGQSAGVHEREIILKRLDLSPRLRDEIDAMIGDVNLFISETQQDDDDHGSEMKNGDSKQPDPIVGELELMIAERAQQGNGYGKAVLLLFLSYIMRNEQAILEEFRRGDDGKTSDMSPASEQLPLRFDHFCVKIGQDNLRSIVLFEGLGFRKTDALPSYFGEFELRLGREGAETLLGQRSLEAAVGRYHD